jgi:hypothetical protein
MTTYTHWENETAPEVDGTGIYLFLDIDGVLNDSTWFTQRNAIGGRDLDPDEDPYHVAQLDPYMVEVLNLLVDKINAKVVLSSSWRSDGMANVQRWLNMAGFRHKLVGRTPRDYNRVRGKEIREWIQRYGITPDQIVILDDDADMEDLLPQLVRTTYHGKHPERGGLLTSHIEEAAALLRLKG